MNFIEGNAFVSGNRWRCRVCEKFVSWQALEYCSYTARMLREFAKEASPRHDRIEVKSDGKYRLLDERAQRHGKRKERSEPANARAIEAAKRPKISDNEIIIL